MTAISQMSGETSTVIQISGRLDIRNAMELKSQILSLIESDRQLIVRLTETDWIDASIAQIFVLAQKLGVLLELGVGNSPELIKLLQSTKTLVFSKNSHKDSNDGE